MFITLRRLNRGLRASCPTWLVWLWIICGFIPTPFEMDELLPATLTLLFLLWRPKTRILRFMAAWRGGKSHRVFDGC